MRHCGIVKVVLAVGWSLTLHVDAVGLAQSPGGLQGVPGAAAGNLRAMSQHTVMPLVRLPGVIPDAQVVPTSHVQAAPAASLPAPEGASPQQLTDLVKRLDAAEAELAALRGGQSARSGVFTNTAARIQDPNSPADDDDTELRIRALEASAAAAKSQFPLIRISGFMQVDEGLFSQDDNSRATLGDIQNGVGFRRARLQALGALSEFTKYSIEVDFAVVGRPSFMDVWGEQSSLPFFGTVRIGQFRQPTTMDALTSIRHLEFLERSLPFQALDPFRRVGIMAYRNGEDDMSTIAYSLYGTGLTFFNGTPQYSTLGDTRFGEQIGDRGGVSTAIRATRLLYYDELAEGRYLLHVGGGYNFSEIGGNGNTGGTDASTYDSRGLPEFFVGDPNGGGLTAAGTPFVSDTGRILAHNFHFAHLELAGNYGAAHFQAEYMATALNQMSGPTVFYSGAYIQTGYFLTGESAGYNKITGVMDYNVKPFADFFGLGADKWMCGWGAWELAFRWSYLNLAATNVNPANIVLPVATTPPNPDPGAVNQSTLALNWWWNQYTRVQFNWIHSMLDNNARGFSAMDIYAARFQIEF
jgi:phosphate-selective porin OprO and OprP